MSVPRTLGSRILALLVGWCLGLVASLMPAQADVRAPVDVELVLAVNGATGIDDDAFRLQRAAYAAAIESPEVQAAIASGINGRISVLLLEWGGAYSQSVVVDWSVIEGPASAADFARAVRQGARRTIGEGGLAAAVATGIDLLEGSRYSGLRRAIDVVSHQPDGGSDAELARIRSLARSRGIVINALAIGRPGGQAAGSLAQTLRSGVISGPTAFVQQVDAPGALAEAVRRQLVVEIAGPVFLNDLERRWGARAESALPGPGRRPSGSTP